MTDYELEQQKNELKNRIEDYLLSKGISTTKPIRCLNPAHPDHNPSMSFDREHKCLHCFSCGAVYDIFDLVGIDEHITDFAEQYKRVNEMYGNGQQATHSKPTAKVDKPGTEEKPANYESFFLEANKNLNKTDYHRGISESTLNRFNVGYVQNWKAPNVPDKVPTSPRLIIPTSSESYIARDTRPEATEYLKQKVGKVHIFNSEALKTATKPIFVVEGEIDALSLIDIGAEAVGLGSVTMANKFRSILEETKPTQPLILALDNEDKEQVKNAVNIIKTSAEKIGIKVYETLSYGKYKDANEMLQADREQLAQAVAKAEEQVKEIEEADIIAEKQEHFSNKVSERLADFIQAIGDTSNWNTYSTGFSNIDTLLDGGLAPGLYVLGAVPSLGKTTMMLQMADNLAKNNDVLIFSLEMSRNELIAKSLSRLTCINAGSMYGDIEKHAKTTRGILEQGKRYKYWTEEDHKVFDNALKDYSYIADNLYIFEGLGNMGVEDIRAKVEKHISLTGKKPAVFVDYLQVIAPYNERATDKQNVDKNVLELKRITSQCKIPLFIVSSLNRAGYSGKVKMEDFKESGAVEYGADVLLGLQFADADSKDFDINKAKAEKIRAIELLVLKNRNGTTGSSAQFDYYPAFNYIREA